MTDETLRDLLEDRVADLGTRDLATGAWSEGVRRRRRRRATVLTGVAAATALVVGVATLAGGSDPGDPGPAEPPASTDPDAVVRGAHVWWGPTLEEEADLEQVASPLPEQVDLDEQAPEAPEAAGTTGPPARAAFAVLDGSRVDHVLLVGDDGDRTLDVSRLEPVTKPNGYRLPPVSDTMLSPDGRTLAFGQDGAVVFFDITLGTWREVPVDGPTHAVRWAGPRLLALTRGAGISVDGAPVDLDLAPQPVLGILDPAAPVGPATRSAGGVAEAQAFGYGADVPARPGSSRRPDTVVVQDGTAPEVLAISAETNDGRFKDCCPVAGWLDGDTVVYESRSAEPRLVSWDVGTRTFGLVTTLVGLADPDASYVASYAQLDVVPTGSTAPDPVASEPDETVDGTQVWWAPEASEEASLPALETAARPLPRTIDLAATDPVPSLPEVRAVFEVAGGRYVVLAPDGTTSLLDAARLGPVADEAGNPLSPLTAGAGLDPGGTTVAFAQDRSVAVYSFLGRAWTTVDTGDEPVEGVRWLRSGLLVLPSGNAFAVDGTPKGGRVVEWKSAAREGESAYGPTSVVEGAVAQTVRLAGPLSGGDLANPEAVVVQRGSERRALALPGADRAKGCCPVVGLLDAGTVVFRSGDALLAWAVGTPDVRLVSRLFGGSGWTGSFADLS